MVREDRPVTELIDSNYTFINDKLALLYGMPAVDGSEMRRVDLPAGSPRGGVLTQGSALFVTSNPDRTSPVKRGLFVLANFLGTPPPPPPGERAGARSQRGGLQGPRSRRCATCSSCIAKTRPARPATTAWTRSASRSRTSTRSACGATSERKQPIQAQGNLITGETFTSVTELKKILATGPSTGVLRHPVAKAADLRHRAAGTEYYDVETIDGIVNRLNANDGRFSALLMGVIESAPFQKMRIEATATVSQLT